MTTGQRPRMRRWFQFHLSTAVVLFLAVALLLWLNLVPTEKHIREHVQPAPDVFIAAEVHYSSSRFGWPWTAYAVENHTIFGESKEVRRLAVAGDVVVGVVILGLLALVGEWRARRRLPTSAK